MRVLFEHSEKELWNKMKFGAALQGVDLDKASAEETKAKKSGDELVFKDPKEYEKLSPEERKELTDKMYVKFKAWAKTTSLEKMKNGHRK
jgi:hypothetical protein